MLYFHDIKLKEKTLFQFSEQYNDFKFLIQFIKAKRDLDYIVGYNMEKYGNYILNYLLSNSDKLINDNGLMISYKLHMLSEGLKSQVFPMELKYLDLFRSIDLIKYMNFNERIYFHNIRLEFGEDSFLDIDNEDFVPVRMFNDIIEYLKSNIRVITKLYEMYKEDIALRHDISRSIGLNIMNKFYYGIGNNLIFMYIAIILSNYFVMKRINILVIILLSFLNCSSCCSDWLSCVYTTSSCSLMNFNIFSARSCFFSML